MNSVVLYGVYTAKLPFLDTFADKIRPVIIISQSYGEHNVAAVVPISSRTKKESVDVKLHDWQDAGLIMPSVARTHRLTTLLQSDLVSYLGTLSGADKQRLQQALMKMLNL